MKRLGRIAESGRADDDRRREASWCSGDVGDGSAGRRLASRYDEQSNGLLHDNNSQAARLTKPWRDVPARTEVVR